MVLVVAVSVDGVPVSGLVISGLVCGKSRLWKYEMGNVLLGLLFVAGKCFGAKNILGFSFPSERERHWFNVLRIVINYVQMANKLLFLPSNVNCLWKACKSFEILF